MGWESSLVGLAQAPKKVADFSGFIADLGQRQFKAQLQLSGGYDPYTAVSSNWLSSFSAAKPKAGYTPAAFPEAINVTFPWSSGASKPFVSRGDTSGDFIGSLGASFDNALWQNGYLNVANAIPWSMERGFVIAREVANKVGGDGNLASDVIDNAAKFFIAAAEPVDKVFSWFPNTVRDAQLNSRAEIYKAFVTGQRVGLLPTILATGADIPRIGAVNRIVDLLSGGGTPDEVASARSLAASMVDLPESVKRAIEKDPNGDFAKYLDEAPEGRKFSYDPGVGGFLANAGSMGLLYAIEMLLLSRIGGGLLGSAGMVKGAPFIPSLLQVAGSSTGMVRAAKISLALAGEGASVIAKVQKVALASGISIFGASTLIDATLRTMGDEQGVAYLDRINRTTLVSHSPAVQLVSSFTVNPIGAAKAAVKGELKFLGAPLVVIDKASGGRLSRMYNHHTKTLDILAKMYGTTRAGAEAMIGNRGALQGQFYETKGQAYAQVLDLAADSFLQKLPEAAKSAITALPTKQRQAAMWAQYSGQILDEVAAPAGLVARFRRDWSHHDFYGEFDPNIAGLVTVAFRNAGEKLGAAMERLDAVRSYVEVLNPEGQAIVADKIAAIFAGGRRGTLRDLNALSVDHPALNGLVKDMVAKGQGGSPFVKPLDAVPREVFDEALSRAKAAYDARKLSNPVRVATGSDPILRKGTRPHEWAEALDTTEGTIAALNAARKRTPAQDGLVAAFIRQKGLATDAEIAAATADDLYAKAYRYFDETTEPWVRRGDEVAVLEKGLGEAGDKVEYLRNIKAGRKEIADAEEALQKYRELLYDVREPYTTHASSLRFARDVEGVAMDRARSVVSNRATVAALKSVDDAVAPAQVHVATRGATLLDSVEQAADGTWVWVADVRTTSGSLFDTAVSYYKAWAFRGKYNRKVLGQFENDTPPVGQADQMARSDGFMRMLRGRGDEVAVVPEVYGAPPGLPVTFNQIADMVEANRRTVPVETEITESMVKALGVTTREAFIEKLGALRAVRDEALAGSTREAVAAAANARVQAWALKRAEAGEPAALHRDYTSDMAHSNALWALRGALDGNNTFPMVREIVKGDPRLLAQVREVAERSGSSVDDFLDNPANAPAGYKSVFPDEMPDRYIEGTPQPRTPLDEAISRGDAVALEDFKPTLDTIRGTLTPPLRNVPIDLVDAIARVPRVSVKLADDLNAAGIHWNTVIPESLWSKSPEGARALSYLLTGRLDQRPRTIMGLLSVLRDIENGNAANAGMGAQLAAEAQSLGQRVVANMIGDARRAGLEVGVIGMGKLFNPNTWDDDTAKLVDDLFGQEALAGTATFRDPVGLQYGLKPRPRGKIDPKTGEVLRPQAVVSDIATLPGLAEELLVGRFQPWTERIGAVQIQQTFGRLFHLPNQQVTFEARGRFEKQLAQYGVPAKGAEAVWTAWRDFAKKSRKPQRVKDAEGRWVSQPGEVALYATEKNIPNGLLDDIADEALARFYGDAGGVPLAVGRIRMSEEMRLAGSFTRRQLQKAPVMGDFLQQTYGKFAHNEWATTNYFIFRFSLDIRFRAQNAVEGRFLYTGRAGLRTREIDEGMFGQNKAAVKRLGEIDTMSDTGYPFNVTREEWLYRTFLKEQPDALRGLVAADPALMRRALLEIAERDPELAVTIAKMGHTPNQYIKIMDNYYGKLMRSSDPEALIKAELMKDLVDSPALAEVYGRIYEVNARLVGDIRAMMYGNPNRGQIERTLNSYLLYWPISYQIKATKWLLNIMYGKIGGVQTGGLGALTLDRLQADHMKRMAEDPEYVRFFEENQALVFAASMLIPMSPWQMGTGLSPLWRDLFFSTSKAVLAVGPVYTITRFIPGIAGDLYPYLKDVPFVDAAYKALTGWAAPKEKKPKGFVPLAP